MSIGIRVPMLVQFAAIPIIKCDRYNSLRLLVVCVVRVRIGE